MALSPQEITLASTALGGILGLAGGIGGSYYIEKWKNDRFSKNIAWAFYGEISSICELIRHREYVEFFKDLSNELNKGSEVNRKAMKADNEYFNIYKSNANNIGVLAPGLPEKIVSFYTYGTAVLEDIHSLSSGYHDDKSNESMSEYFEGISQMFYDILKRGDEIVQVIERQYS